MDAGHRTTLAQRSLCHVPVLVQSLALFPNWITLCFQLGTSHNVIETLYGSVGGTLVDESHHGQQRWVTGVQNLQNYIRWSQLFFRIVCNLPSRLPSVVVASAECFKVGCMWISSVLSCCCSALQPASLQMYLPMPDDVTQRPRYCSRLHDLPVLSRTRSLAAARHTNLGPGAQLQSSQPARLGIYLGPTAASLPY